MDVSDWEAIAVWYDAKMGDEGDLWHRTLIDPALVALLGEVAGQRLLDLGCGNGYLSRRFARAGAAVTAIDASGPAVALARAREEREPLGIVYHQADAAHLTMLADGTIDVAIANMTLMDIADAAGAIGEVGRVLRPGGRFVAVLAHPCFETGPSSVWEIEFSGYQQTVARKTRRYREVHVDEIPWPTDQPGVVLFTKSYHRPLSWYVGAYRAAGLAIVALEEPSPLDEMIGRSPQAEWIRDVAPLHCAIEAIKLPEEVARRLVGQDRCGDQGA
ncbi:MAG: class I SAM-dependent methyltransferase [Dehalococcoidia bacterium]|nr:MAG: class I SAM-dependent methyltransferase [Dehalococcoidia bacterium]